MIPSDPMADLPEGQKRLIEQDELRKYKVCLKGLYEVDLEIRTLESRKSFLLGKITDYKGWLEFNKVDMT